MNAITQPYSADYWQGYADCRNAIDARKAFAQSLVATLTGRQRDVILLTMQGQSLEQIGADLGISWRTAEKHRQSALKKLGVGSAFEAVVIATRAGLGE